MFHLVIFGPPGAGKGTQSKKIAEHYGLVHISTGDIFRNEISRQTKTGLKAKSFIDKGRLVPDKVLIDMLENVLDSNDSAKGFVWDGFPRTIVQAGEFDNLLARKNNTVSLVLALKVNERELVRRLVNRSQLEGRSDDQKEIITQRLKVYKEATIPIIEFYKKQKKLRFVPGMGSVEMIFSDICGVIDHYISS